MIALWYSTKRRVMLLHLDKILMYKMFYSQPKYSFLTNTNCLIKELIIEEVNHSQLKLQ